MIVEPYVSVDSLRFGESVGIDYLKIKGNPESIQKNQSGDEELIYPDAVFRFDRETSRFRECTLLPYTTAEIGGIRVTWDREFLKACCFADGTAVESYGFVVFRRLGIMVSGIHDDDASQLAITAFAPGVCKVMKREVAFDASRL